MFRFNACTQNCTNVFHLNLNVEGIETLIKEDILRPYAFLFTIYTMQKTVLSNAMTKNVYLII